MGKSDFKSLNGVISGLSCRHVERYADQWSLIAETTKDYNLSFKIEKFMKTNPFEFEIEKK
jgi:hypothetical protein